MQSLGLMFLQFPRLVTVHNVFSGGHPSKYSTLLSDNSTHWAAVMLYKKLASSTRLPRVPHTQLAAEQRNPSNPKHTPDSFHVSPIVRQFRIYSTIRKNKDDFDFRGRLVKIKSRFVKIKCRLVKSLRMS